MSEVALKAHPVCGLYASSGLAGIQFHDSPRLPLRALYQSPVPKTEAVQ